MEPSWESIVDEKRARQLAAIPPAWRLPEPVRTSSQSLLEIIRSCGILTSEELQWTEVMDISELVSLVASRKVSSVQLTTAFCKRAAIAQQLSKCLTEIFFDQALVQAQNLDEHLEKTGTVVGPLHGVPVSVKDRFDIKGLDTTFGIVLSSWEVVKIRIGADCDQDGWDWSTVQQESPARLCSCWSPWGLFFT